MEKLFKIIKYILFSILVFLAIICVSVFIQIKLNPNKIPSIFGYKPFIVLSGSMESELYKGDLAIVREVNPKTLRKQDIIAFKDKTKYVVTHRIVDIHGDDKELEFVTKGDNNNNNDEGVVKFDDVEGKYVGKIKGLGNVLLVLKKPITLIVILLIIIVFGGFWIALGHNKLSNGEREELESLRKEKARKNN